MARYHNKKHAKQVAKLKERGLSYTDISEKMTRNIGIPFSRNKAIRYKKYYDQLSPPAQK